MRQEYDFKVGDLVVVKSRYRERVAIIEKITPTGRAKVCNLYYSKDGSKIGGDIWDRGCIVPATEEIIERINRQEYIDMTLKRMNAFNREMSYEDAMGVNNILCKYFKVEN